MLKLVAPFVLVGLVLAQVGGCASYNQGTFPVAVQYSEEEEETVEIRVGSEVQIETIDGEEVSGEVIRVSDCELVVGKATNYGFDERIFNRDQIAQVKVRKEALVPTIVVTTIGMLAITATTIVVLGILVGVSGGTYLASN